MNHLVYNGVYNVWGNQILPVVDTMTHGDCTHWLLVVLGALVA